MRKNQASARSDGGVAVLERPKFTAKPRRNPDHAKIRRRIMVRYSKTLAYLGK